MAKTVIKAGPIACPRCGRRDKMVYVDFGRAFLCGWCKRTGPVRAVDRPIVDRLLADWHHRLMVDTTTDIDRVTGMRSVSIGSLAAQKNCRNCGAPSEPQHPTACGWCLTPH